MKYLVCLHVFDTVIYAKVLLYFLWLHFICDGHADVEMEVHTVECTLERRP